jgi:hypothetical protein
MVWFSALFRRNSAHLQPFSTVILSYGIGRFRQTTQRFAPPAENLIVHEWRGPRFSLQEQKMAVPNFYSNELPLHATSWYREGRRYTPPREEIVAAFLTIIAKYAARYDIGIAAWALMGSHPHILAFDRNCGPDEPSRVWLFRQQVNATFAKWLNNYWKLKGQVFSGNVKSQLVHIVDAKRAVFTFGYIVNNPVAAGLVSSAEEMPHGSVSLPELLREPIVVPRPDSWFRPNRWPEEASIKLEMPPLAEDDGFTLESWETAVSLSVTQRMFESHYCRTGPEKGLNAILSETPHIAHDPDRVNQSRARHSGTDRQRLAALYERERAHQRAYRRAFERMRQGETDVEFPWGTGRMVVSYGFKMSSA